ncbi:MAG: hypothetical protein L0027_04325 [Candidatus Rokubacteria bacterium]|nr:hypothetical protein [Candidatus Rokubacteria bacterium]
MSNAPFPGVPRVDLEGAPAPDAQSIGYVARLRDDSGRPLAGAEVTLVAVASDGSGLRAELHPAGSGHYQGWLATGGREVRDVRVHIALEGRRFDIPLLR